jgi:hypothetical protein
MRKPIRQGTRVVSPTFRSLLGKQVLVEDDEEIEAQGEA